MKLEDYQNLIDEIKKELEKQPTQLREKDQYTKAFNHGVSKERKYIKDTINMIISTYK